MSKEYTYFEAMEEILKNKSKVLKQEKLLVTRIMYCNKDGLIMINDKDEAEYFPYISKSWINTKWTLVEEKKKYNVRVYNVSNDKLIHSEVVKMTKHEVILYCNSKTVLGEVKKIRDNRNNTLFIIREMNKTRVECEEIITT